MAGRLNYYFRQKVTEAELDLGFALLESADFALATDNGLVGIVNGAAVSQRTAGANLTVDIAAGIVYDKLGRRIAWGAVQNVDLSVDENAVSTAVSTPGSTKVLSIFAKFIRNETDPRIDGNGNTVYFNRAESFQFLVRQGAESAGTPSPPALDPEYILIADVVRRNPQPAITDTSIVDNPTYSGTPALSPRRETPFAFSVSSLSVRERTAEDSDRAVLQHLQDHITDPTSVHAGTAISFSSTTNWADGSTIVSTTVSQAINEIVQDLANSSACVGWLPGGTTWTDGATVSALNVQDALREIIADLATQVAAQSGARKIGIEARTAWLGGRTNPASGLYAAIDKIITDLGATTAGDDGAERIGTQPSGNLSSVNVRGQLDELDAEKANLADIQIFTTAGANTWTKPAAARWVEVMLVGGGGGGGSGQSNILPVDGGGGGGGGARVTARFSASLLSATETVTVGAGGAGGAAITSGLGGNGNNGTAGGSTTFTVGGATAVVASGGAGGAGGNTAGGGGAGGVGGLSDFSGGNGGAGSTNGGLANPASTYYNDGTVLFTAMAAGGGGGGGGGSNAPAYSDGGAGGRVQFSYRGGGGGGAGGVVGGAAAQSGTSVVANVAAGGGGGGGGAGGTTGLAGAQGGLYGGGGGGGGGGGQLVVINPSGAGGAGRSGIAVVVAYF